MSGNFAIKGGWGVGRLMANAILNFYFDFPHTSLIGVLDGPEPGSQDPALCKGLLCIHRYLREWGGGVAKTMRNVWLMLKISFCVGVYNLDNDGPEVTPGPVHSNWLVSTLGLCNNWLVWTPTTVHNVYTLSELVLCLVTMGAKVSQQIQMAGTRLDVALLYFSDVCYNTLI